MERISYYKGNKVKNTFLISLGVIAILIGIVGIFGVIFSIDWLNEKIGKWNITTYILVGGFYLFIYFSLIKRKRKFIEWNDKLIRYSLPGTKKTEEINVADIETVNINLSDIILQLKNSSSRKINLEGLDFKDIKLVKGFFTKFK